MSRLDTATVDAAVSALKSRALAAIDTIQKKKTILGGWFGNNDTLDSDAGAIRTLVTGDNCALAHWGFAGYEAVDDDSKVDSWLATGRTIESSIAKIDGYSDTATLDSVVKLTVAQTAADTADLSKKAISGALGFAWSALPWYVWGAVAVAAGGVVYFKVIRK